MRPLRVHELDAHALGRVNFDAAGLIVAEKDGTDRRDSCTPGSVPMCRSNRARPLELSYELGTVAMLVVEPDLDDRELVCRPDQRSRTAIFRHRGAKVVYAGGLFPLNPFYWGIYGGSEGCGRALGASAVSAAS